MRFLRAILSIFLLASAVGCASPLSPATKAAIDQVKNQAAIDAAKAKAAADAAQAKADANAKALEAAAKAKPAEHWLEFQNLVIAELRGPLILVGSVTTALFFGGLGSLVAAFFFAALAPLLKSVGVLVASICGTIGGCCWLTLWVLPLAPWILGGGFLFALTLLVIQLIHAKWSLSTLFGLHNKNVATIKNVAAAAKVPEAAAGITLKNPPVISPTPV